MDTNLAVRNALYLATDRAGQRGLTPTQQEVGDFLAHLGEAGYAIVPMPPLPDDDNETDEGVLSERFTRRQRGQVGWV